MRLLFCLFADNIGLLPDHLFRRMIEADKGAPSKFARKLRQLFAAMSDKNADGRTFGMHDIHYFNGGLFINDEVFDLDWRDLGVLNVAAALDWSQVEPAIFGTLFERSLDPGKRSQLGAHYTSKEDILLIVEPVVIKPLQRRWQAVKAEATAKAEAAEKAKGREYTKLRANLEEIVLDWVAELAAVRVLDPACGSGNFLYIALRRMLDLWQESRIFAAQNGLPTFLERSAAVGTASAAAAPNLVRESLAHFLGCVVDRFSAGVVAGLGCAAIAASVYCASVRAPGLYWRVRLPFPARAMAFPSLVLHDLQSQRRLSGAPLDSSPSM